MRLRDASRVALVSGALLSLVGGSLALRKYVGGDHMDREIAGVGAGPDTVGLIGALVVTEGVVLVLAALFVLRPVSGNTPSSVAEHPQSSAEPEGGSTPDLEVRTAQIVTIGGGLGSFALVDRLRIAGVAESDIVVVGASAEPAARFAELCRAAGLRPSDRLRSDSSARMDNLWGFPGYAASEARRRRNPTLVLRTLLEPVTQPYTPTVGHLVDGVNREAKRVGWSDMLATGEAYRVTEFLGGGYVVLVRRVGRPDLAIQTRWVHLALGSAGPRLPQVAERHRARHGSDRVVHAYEPHEKIHRALCRHGGNVLVRGSGIESSRVLARLVEDRDRTGRDVHIWQLFDTYDERGQGFRHRRDRFPMAAYGGQVRDQVRQLDEPERIELVQRLGAPSTPYRPDWAEQLRRGRAEGWYDAVVGEISDLEPTPDGVREGVTATILLGTGERLDLAADYVIDATELDSAAEQHALVRDLVNEGLGELNVLGCLRVDDDFCVSRSAHGGIVASGVTATGAPLAPVDSFLGLQSAALTISHTLADSGVGQPLTPLRSLRSWWHWMKGTSL
jgi:hypothetical protein